MHWYRHQTGYASISVSVYVYCRTCSIYSHLASPYLFIISFGLFWFIHYLSYLLHQWEKQKKSTVEQRWKHQVEHFDDFSSRKARKVKNLLTVLNCQVIKSKVEVVKAFRFLGEKLKTSRKNDTWLTCYIVYVLKEVCTRTWIPNVISNKSRHTVNHVRNKNSWPFP